MRKEKTITINDDGKNLKFLIRQMPTTKAIEFTMKFAALVKAGGSSKENPTFAELFASSDYEKTQEVLDMLLSCCSRILDNGAEHLCSRADLDGYIDSMDTVFTLYSEAMELNFPPSGEEKGTDSPAKVNIGRPRKRQDRLQA